VLGVNCPRTLGPCSSSTLKDGPLAEQMQKDASYNLTTAAVMCLSHHAACQLSDLPTASNRGAIADTYEYIRSMWKKSIVAS
jgi:hypothetical protein